MSSKYFDINSKTETFLGTFCLNRISIIKVTVINGDVNDLFNPIKVTTNLPTGEGFQYFINPSSFFSNKNPGKGTDLNMNAIIHYCNFTNLIISSNNTRTIFFRLQYVPCEDQPIDILVNTDIDGYTFSLTPSSKELILSRFKDSRPIRNIFVGYDVKMSFEMMHGKIENYILPALTE